jgi:hypothetical protein
VTDCLSLVFSIYIYIEFDRGAFFAAADYCNDFGVYKLIRGGIVNDNRRSGQGAATAGFCGREMEESSCLIYCITTAVLERWKKLQQSETSNLNARMTSLYWRQGCLILFNLLYHNCCTGALEEVAAK